MAEDLSRPYIGMGPGQKRRAAVTRELRKQEYQGTALDDYAGGLFGGETGGSVFDPNREARVRANDIGQMVGIGTDVIDLPKAALSALALGSIKAAKGGKPVLQDFLRYEGGSGIGYSGKSVNELLGNFGMSKQARQQATADKIKRQLAATEQGKEVKVQTGGRTTREAVDPRVYREMYDSGGGLDAVLNAAHEEQHMKPSPSGGWVGFPASVQTRRDLRNMRGSLDDQFRQAVDLVTYADKPRMGTWYERQQAGHALQHEPHQLDRGQEGHAVYSAGAAPENETGFSLKDWNQAQLGTGDMAYRKRPAETLSFAIRENRPAYLAEKVGEYRGKSDPRIFQLSPFGVNDFRMAQTFGYTNPAGNPWRAGVSKTMHPVMDAETALMGERANLQRLADRTDWTGAQIQELPWVLGKAEDIYWRGRKGRFAGDEGKLDAIREANNTIADYLYKHTGNVPTNKAWITEGPYQRDMPHWDSPYGAPTEEVGTGGRDALWRATNFKQLPAIDVPGQGTTARPLMDYATGTKAELNPNTRQSVRAVETLRALLDEQAGGGLDIPITLKRKGQGDFMLERSNQQPFSEQDIADVTGVLEGSGAGAPRAFSQGLYIPTGGDLKVKRGVSSLGDFFRDAYPDARLRPANMESVRVQGVSPPEQAGQGIATERALSEFAKAPPNLGANVSESDEVRRLIDNLTPTGREDVAATRDFFKNADWNKAVRLMRQGVPAAAALAGMGYSLTGMAAEPQR